MWAETDDISPKITSSAWTPSQGVAKNVEVIIRNELDRFADNCLSAIVPDTYDRLVRKQYLALPFNQGYLDQSVAGSMSFDDPNQVNLLRANDGSLWVLIYPYSDDIKDYLVTLTGSRVVVADEYWDKKNPIYPVSRVFLGYENT